MLRYGAIDPKVRQEAGVGEIQNIAGETYRSHLFCGNRQIMSICVV